MVKKIALLFCTTTVFLQGQSLQNSLGQVLENNPIILERLANYRETTKDIGIARAEYLPTLDLVSSIGFERTGNKNSHLISQEDKNLNYYENSLTLMWNIFNGFGTSYKVDYQRSRIVAAAYNFIEKADDVAFNLTRTYIELIKQHELLKIAKENITIHEEIFSKINDLYTNGLTTKSEVRKIEASLFLARSNMVVQENNNMDAEFNFKKTFGLSIDSEFVEVPRFLVLLPKTLEEAREYVIRNNPSIMVSNSNIRAAKYLKKQKAKSFYPKIDLIVQQNIDKNTFGIEEDRNRFRAGLTLSYNFYRGGADMDESAKAQESINRNIETKSELEREAVEGLELSWSADKMTAKQLVDLIKYKDYSEDTLELYKEEYNLGKRTLLDLLAVQNDFINAKSQIVKAKYDNLFAKYRILDAMGLLVAGIMGNEYDYMHILGIKEKQ